MTPAVSSTSLPAVSPTVADYIRAAKSEATRTAYSADWSSFTAWCSARNLVPLPAEPRTVALYLADHAGKHAIATLSRRMAAIAKAHQAKGYESPCAMRFAEVAEVWQGIRRTHGVAQKQKTPVLIEDVRRMVATIDATRLTGIRDRALLLIGFASACRRSELVALTFADVQCTNDGLVLTLRRSKTDQEGKGRKVGIPYGSSTQTCPVRAFAAWEKALGCSDGPVFRSIDRHGRVGKSLTPESVADVVKRYAAAAGLDPNNYAGHSLRSGLATQAAMCGAGMMAIMNQTGHRSEAMVRRYIRDGSLFRDNAAARVGL